MSYNTAHREQVKATVEAMISEIGKLRQFMAIDNMPEKLQQVRQLLRELDHDLNVDSFYSDRKDRPGSNSTR